MDYKKRIPREGEVYQYVGGGIFSVVAYTTHFKDGEPSVIISQSQTGEIHPPYLDNPESFPIGTRWSVPLEYFLGEVVLNIDVVLNKKPHTAGERVPRFTLVVEERANGHRR